MQGFSEGRIRVVDVGGTWTVEVHSVRVEESIQVSRVRKEEGQGWEIPIFKIGRHSEGNGGGKLADSGVVHRSRERKEAS